jgi:hypothetical protein
MARRVWVMVFWALTPCSIVGGYQHLGEKRCLHLRGRNTYNRTYTHTLHSYIHTYKYTYIHTHYKCNRSAFSPYPLLPWSWRHCVPPWYPPTRLPSKPGSGLYFDCWHCKTVAIFTSYLKYGDFPNASCIVARQKERSRRGEKSTYGTLDWGNQKNQQLLNMPWKQATR